jgi:hypothetical protein
MVTNPRTRSSYHWPYAIGLAALLALTGCKSNNSDNNTRTGDPLVIGPTRIPPQNVPMPDRGIGANGKSDPLLGKPTSKPQDPSGVGYTDDPSRFKDTFIPSPNSTTAALAAKSRDSEELKIDGNENKVPFQQASAVMPMKPGEQNPALDPLYRELEKAGCKREEWSLRQENGGYVFRAAMPISGGNGAKVQFTEVGRTADEAVKKVLDQVNAEKK